jgi:hypothetical protein
MTDRIKITITFVDDEVKVVGADKLNYGRAKYLEHLFRSIKKWRVRT